MMKELYPPRHRRGKDESSRRWHVDYTLAYDGGGGTWTSYYRTRIGARIAAVWNFYFSSWSSSAVLSNKQGKETSMEDGQESSSKTGRV